MTSVSTSLSSSLSFAAVLDAADTIAGVLPPTPAWSYPALNQEVGAEVVVKHENVQPTGAFKVRGGVAFAASLTGDDRTAGLVTASTGNHAQSIAYAAKLLGAPAIVVMPSSAAPEKEAATRLLGAEVVRHGDTMGAALDHARALADQRGMRFVSPGDEPAIVHGHATVYLELLRSHPSLDAIYVPVGSGSGAAAACLVRDALAPDCAIIGVQSAAAPAAYNSWRAGRVVEAACATRVAGVATSRGCALPLSAMCDRLDDFLLVDDADIMAAMRLMSSAAHTLAEGAGATSLAGALAHTARPRRIAVVCTGGNADAGELAELAAVPARAAG